MADAFRAGLAPLRACGPRLVRRRLSLRYPHWQPPLASHVASRRRPRRGAAPGRTSVIPGAFDYHRPKSLPEAVALLADLGEEARPLAGGHSLIPMMKLRLAGPEHLVDLRSIGELRGIRAEGADIVIGAMTTQYELIGSDLLAAKLPILRETSLVIADPQV